VQYAPFIHLSVIGSPVTRKWKNVQRSNLQERLPSSGVIGVPIFRSKYQGPWGWGQNKTQPHTKSAVGSSTDL